ncbi:MAG: nucleotide exchange factor GrpE [Bacteroidales bacterium]|nr:nucleotide exchange factor GrpE [Bacteroidales bacterium]MBN2748803.1 nucleotide exchange factor GrpE [Bacteroidales bacterium]
MSKKKEYLTEEQVTAEAAGAQENAHAEQPASEQQQEVTTEVTEENPTEELQKQLDEQKDKYLRLSAEFDNFRRRTLKEKMDLTKYAAEDTLKSILPVVDDFERAMKSLDATTDIDAVKEGLRLIHGKFVEFLKTKGVTEIEAMGLPLDTDKHEAITLIPAPEEHQKGKIIDVIEKGYILNEKVIRFSKVIIGE